MESNLESKSDGKLRWFTLSRPHQAGPVSMTSIPQHEFTSSHCRIDLASFDGEDKILPDAKRDILSRAFACLHGVLSL